MVVAAESDWAKIASRVVTPILLTLITVMLGVMVNIVTSVSAEQRTLGTTMATLSTKVDFALVQRIAQLEDRVRTLESKHSRD